MLRTITKIAGISHPYVRSMYLNRTNKIKTLVIETMRGRYANNNKRRKQFSNSFVADLIIDLPDIQHFVEEKYGRFDQVDIRFV